MKLFVPLGIPQKNTLFLNFLIKITMRGKEASEGNNYRAQPTRPSGRGRLRGARGSSAHHNRLKQVNSHNFSANGESLLTRN